MATTDEQARRLSSEVDALHPAVARVLRRLDRKVIADLARESLLLRTIDPVLLLEVFTASLGATLSGAYVIMADAAADGVPATGQARLMGERASAALAADLAARARTRAAAVLGQALAAGWPLARLIRALGEQLMVSNDIVEWTRTYRLALMGDPKAALDRALRDTSFDPRALRGQLTPTEIDQMVAAYRRNLIAWRAGRIAWDTLRQGANQVAVQNWLDAEAGGLILPGARKFWVVMDDRAVRGHHHDIPGLNPHGVAMHDHFQTPLGPLLYPHDPAGSADNINGCRCMVAVARST